MLALFSSISARQFMISFMIKKLFLCKSFVLDLLRKRLPSRNRDEYFSVDTHYTWGSIVRDVLSVSWRETAR